MISGSYQLLSTVAVQAGRRSDSDCHVPGRFRALPVTALNDHRSILNLEKKNAEESSNGCTKVLVALCSLSPSVRAERKVLRKSDKAEVLAQLTVDEGNQSIKDLVLSKRLARKAVNDYFGKMPWQKAPSPGSESHSLPVLLHTVLAKSAPGVRLHRKAAANNLRQLEMVMRHAGTDINCQSSKSGITPLLWAAINRHWAMALTLLEAGALVHLKGRSGQHFLAHVFTAKLAQEIPVMQYRRLICSVLLNQAELKLATVRGEETVCAYVWKNIVAQADISLFECLLKSVPSIKDQLKSYRVVERMMVMVIAGVSDRSDVVLYLMGLPDSDGDPLINMNHTLDNGDTFLMLAVKCHKRQTVKVLLEDPVIVANINRVNKRKNVNYSAYAYACRDSSFTLMKMLEEKGAVRFKSAVDGNVRDSRPVRRTTGHTTYYSAPATAPANWAGVQIVDS